MNNTTTEHECAASTQEPLCSIHKREYSRYFPWLHPLPRLDLAPDTEEGFACCGTIPNDDLCFELCASYGIMDHIQTHCLRVADFAEAMAWRALEVPSRLDSRLAPPTEALPGYGTSPLATSEACSSPNRARVPYLVALTRAAGLLHDIAKSYTIRHGGSHAQIGASWVIERTGNRLLGQSVLHHVEWPWVMPQNVCLPVFFVNYADRRVKHATYVTMTERYQDLLERYGTTESSHRRICEGWEQAKNLESALAAQLELPIHACTYSGRRLV